MIKTLTYDIHEITPYINWLYFFFAWQLPSKYASLAAVHDCKSCRAGWLAGFPPEEQPRAEEAIRLYDEAQQALRLFEGKYHTRARFGLFEASTVGDDIEIYTESDMVSFPLLRQQHAVKPGEPNLCLSDFIRPRDTNQRDRIGVFATTVDLEMEESFADDPYRHMLAQTLSDRLAEAAAEVMHRDVRRRWWGYAPDEDLQPQDLIKEKYQGIRPAVGYPSLPDQSVNFILNSLLDLPSMGIQLTETGAMRPHASVSGLMFSHPLARYFSVGRIGEDQLADYARRRGVTEAYVRQFLTANL